MYEYLIITFILILAAGGGMGGGVLLLPVLLFACHLPTHAAVALSNTIIFAASIANLILNVHKTAHGSVLLINWPVVALMEPPTALCGKIGATISQLMPKGQLILLAAAMLWVISWSTTRRFFQSWRDETQVVEADVGIGMRATEEGLTPPQPPTPPPAVTPSPRRARSLSPTISPHAVPPEWHYPPPLSIPDETFGLDMSGIDLECASPIPQPQPPVIGTPPATTLPPLTPSTSYKSSSSMTSVPFPFLLGDRPNRRNRPSSWLGESEREEEEEADRDNEWNAMHQASLQSWYPSPKRPLFPRGSPPAATLPSVEPPPQQPHARRHWLSLLADDHDKVLIMFSLFFFMLMCELWRTKSRCGSVQYWMASIVTIPAVLAAFLWTRAAVLRSPFPEAQEPAAAGLTHSVSTVHDDGTLGLFFTPRNTLTYPAYASIAGLLAGLLGMGGGIILAPLLLTLGVAPRMSAASSATMIFFTTGIAWAVYTSSGHIEAGKGWRFGALGFAATLLGQVLTNKLIKKFRRPSLIVAAMAALTLAAAVVMTVRGGLLIHQAWAHHDTTPFTEWGELCPG